MLQFQAEETPCHHGKVQAQEYLMQTYDLPILAVIPDHFRFGKQQNYYKYKSYQSFGRTEVKK